jgi:myo-inositol 2-dehydrogenase/D-chiro-inositol 1-dehydrogenase
MPSEANSKNKLAANRRDFLKLSAAGAAAVGGLSPARSAHAAGKEVVKIGMIGCGGRCSGAASEALEVGPWVKLVAMYDVFESRLKAKHDWFKANFAKQFQVDDAHCFSDFGGYQKVIDASDVVLIACASKFHPMYSEAAIKSGKHVFVEKPHGIDPAGYHQLKRACDLAKQKNLSIVSGMQSRFHAGYRETVQRIHDGQIGDIVAMQSMFLRAPYQTVGRDPKLTETQYQFSNWYHFCWLSGDDVTQSLVHNLDRAAWIMKDKMPKWCFGLGGRASSYGEVYGDMFDHHTVVYEYESGARIYALCRTEAGCYDNSSDIVMGTKGICHLGDCRFTTPSGQTTWRFKGPHNNPYLAEQKALIEAVRDNKPINSGYHMCNSNLFAVMGQIACYSGKPTTWEEVVASNFRFGPAPEEISFKTPPPSTPDEHGNYPLPLPGITKLL